MQDTPRHITRVQIDLLRRAGPRRRAALASAMTNQALGRARRGIARAHPEMSEREQQLLFVAVHYGRPLAGRLRTFLEAQDRGDG